MPNNWKTYKLGDLGILARGKSKHRPRDASHLYGGEYPFIQTGDVKAANHRLNNHTQTYSKDGLAQSKLWPKNTMCITIAANIAETAIIDYPACFPDSIIGFIANDAMCDIDFVEYLMQHFKKQIQTHSIGSVQDNINLATFERVEFKFPPLPEQRAIASILSALDDKIELNLQMNKTLEEMAMTLYKHWFVDFGPFQNGEFVDSELGMIPKGWEVKRLEDIFSVKDGTHDSPKQKDEGHYLITSKHIRKNEIDFSSAYKISAEDFQKVNQRSKVDNGDILMTMIGTVGVFYLVNQTPNYAIKNIGLFKTSEVIELKYFMFLFFNSDFSTQYIKSQLAGSTQQYLTLKVLRNFPFLQPTKEVLKRFNSLISGKFEMIQNNILENQILTTLRDTLLPKLISGEVRVKEAETILEEAL